MANKKSAHPLIEVCLDSTESAVAAEEGGAQRVELCANLIEGGTTPSAGVIAATRQCISIGMMVMIRPRGGDFCYTSYEFSAMCADVQIAKELGADGVVFGILTPDGRVDVRRCEKLIAMADPLPVTFHRAFDVSRDPFEALETLIKIGAHRVLTSGQEPNVLEGLDLLQKLVQRAGKRIIVMPGCGITLKNMQQVARTTKARELHVVGISEVASKMKYKNPSVYMGTELRSPEYSRWVTSSAVIKELVRKSR